LLRRGRRHRARPVDPHRAGPAGVLAQELERGVEIAVARRHHEVERRIGPTGTITKVLDPVRVDLEVALALVEFTAGRGLTPVRPRLVAATCRAAVVE